MKKRRVIISLKARNSLYEYYEYLKNEVSKETADYVKNGILQSCRDLKDFSGYSKEFYLEDLPGDYRSVSKWKYKIIFKVTENEVHILNIIHTSRHPDNFKNV
ncbi:MAG: type II toxin-antitoxin system RelE/ParE family toxin [Tangfeifania sp.]